LFVRPAAVVVKFLLILIQLGREIRPRAPLSEDGIPRLIEAAELVTRPGVETGGSGGGGSV
jgi:hypothetical protein